MNRFVCAAAVALAASLAHAQGPVSTAFTFQGVFQNNGAPAVGAFDFEFRLYDSPAGLNQIGPTICTSGVLSDGHMGTQLDFGTQFAGQKRYLALSARPQDVSVACYENEGTYTVLYPRQELTAAPNAVFSLNAGAAANATQLGGQPASFYSNASNLTGTLNDAAIPTTIPRLTQNNSFSGYLGVGTFGTPNARLQVQGPDNTSNGLGAAMQINNTASGGGTWYLRSGASGTNTPAGGFSIADSVGYRFTIDNAGRVGIGTTTPTSILDIEGAGTTVRMRNNGDPGYLNLWDTSGGYFFGFANTSASAWGTVPANSTRSYFVVQNGGQVGSTVDTGAAVSYRNLLDDGTGNAIFDVIGANTGAIASSVRFGASGSGEGIGSKRNAGGNQNGLDFYTASTPRVSITNSGSVGIGTTAPGALLELDGATPSIRFKNNPDAGYLQLMDVSNAYFFEFVNPTASAWGAVPANSTRTWFGVQNNGGVFTTNDNGSGVSPRNTLDDGAGNVNISGTLTSHSNASVSGGVNVDSAGLANSTGQFQSQPNVLRFGTAPSGEGITSKRTSGGNQYGLDFFTGNAVSMSITNGGSVGIGTSSPASKLHLLDGTLTVSASAGGSVVTSVSANHNGGILLYNATSHIIAEVNESGLGAGLGGQMVIADQNGVAHAGFQMQPAGTGIMFADVKNFVANNPDDPKTQLYYACVEGPEAAMYCRGTARLDVGHATVQLPRHFAVMAAAQGITVQITPLSADCMGIAVTRKSTDSFEVTELFKGQNTCDFDWEVKAIRKGYEDYQVIRPAGLLNPKPLAQSPQADQP
jgi:hypothetical protein